MMDWEAVWLQDGLSPSMMIMSFFHDHLMALILSITVFTLVIVVTQVASTSVGTISISDNFVETVWTMLPALILLGVAFPSMKVLYASEADLVWGLTFRATGNQWYWDYSMPGSEDLMSMYMLEETPGLLRTLETDSYLSLPYGVHLRNLISSNDVIHAWAIPSWGLKGDAVPGRVSQLFVGGGTPGAVFGQCSEICGANHSFMPISLALM